MALPLVSTVPAVRAALETEINERLPSGVKCYRAWPGPDAAAEMVVLGKVEGSHEIAAIKAGRRFRNETYSIEAEAWVFGAAGMTPTNVGPVEDRAWELMEAVENTLAVDPTIDGTQTVNWAGVGRIEMDVATFEKGWAVRVLMTIEVTARLT